jgi:thiol-disulfide isomerase/thioredoxin
MALCRCGHCKAMKPDFVKASEEAQSSGMVFSAIDCTSSSTICGEYGVNGYPTVKSFHQGKAADYEGGRNAADMVKFASSFGTEKSEEGATKTKKNAKVEIDKDDL